MVTVDKVDKIYIETTVVGNVAGRIQPNPDVATRQRDTRQWWGWASKHYEFVISQLVLDECRGGDPEAARERLEAIQSLTMMRIDDDARDLARLLGEAGAVPISEPRDALHIAVAAVQGVQYLVTWNFKHIANATLRSKIEQTCIDAGHSPPIICTPPEIPGEDDD